MRLMIGLSLRQQVPAILTDEDPCGSEEQNHDNDSRRDHSEEIWVTSVLSWVRIGSNGIGHTLLDASRGCRVTAVSI